MKPSFKVVCVNDSVLICNESFTNLEEAQSHFVVISNRYGFKTTKKQIEAGYTEIHPLCYVAIITKPLVKEKYQIHILKCGEVEKELQFESEEEALESFHSIHRDYGTPTIIYEPGRKSFSKEIYEIVLIENPE